MIDLKKFEENSRKALDFLKKEIQTIRTNRASTDLVTHISVEAYGVKTSLEQLATITVPEPRLIVDCLLKTAYTGEIGDGKIFVWHVEESYRIRNLSLGEGYAMDTAGWEWPSNHNNEQIWRKLPDLI